MLDAHQYGTLRLSVSGPTGSGKSTLVHLLATHPGVRAIPEPRPTDLLRRFDAEPELYCFELQRTILLARLNEVPGVDGQIRVLDRGPDEDVAIFAAMFHAAGYLSGEQLAELRNLSTHVSGIVGAADAFVLLTAQKDVLERRIRAAAAPDRVVALLAEQIRLYQQWCESLVAPRITLDTSRLAVYDLAQRGAWILSSLARACAGDCAQNLALGLAWTH
jgi:deoxyadenosine/deoxycytidine kinase